MKKFKYFQISFSRFGNEEKDFQFETESKLNGEVYDVQLSGQIKKSDIADESTVTCLVAIPDSDYAKRETITYDGMKSFQFLNKLMKHLFDKFNIFVQMSNLSS